MKRLFAPFFGLSAIYLVWHLVAFRQHAPLLLALVAIAFVSIAWLLIGRHVKVTIMATIAGVTSGLIASQLAAMAAAWHFRGQEVFFECCVRWEGNYMLLSLGWLFSGALFLVGAKRAKLS